MKKETRSSGILNVAARPFVIFVERYYPDPFVFLIGLTGVAFICAIGMTDTTLPEAVAAWGGGLSSLMAFTAQIAITLVAAHALAHTYPVQRGLRALTSRPSRAWQAYAMVAFCSGVANLFAWSLGLVVGATLARAMALEGKRRGMKLDFPLLVASAYSGFVVWHMGYSGSAPLFVATPGHALENAMGIVPVTETIFSHWNIILAFITLCVITLTCVFMQPGSDKVRSISSDVADHLKKTETDSQIEVKTFGDRLGNSRIGSFTLGALIVFYLVVWFGAKGFDLNLDIVNWTLLAAGLLFSNSPVHYVSLAVAGGRSLGPLLLQYPFYAGIMGLLAGSGLVEIFSTYVANNASQETLPLWAFLSGGIVNIFVPSGGGQWAVQGPIFVEAAKSLDVPNGLIVMSVAYGDQWTNMIQPFWTIPLLAIAGLKVRDVMGYTFVTLLVTGVVFGVGLYMIGKLIS